MKVFIIEDDEKLAQELGRLLAENGYIVQIIDDFEDAVGQILMSKADLVLLDVNIPNLSGERILRKVRETSQIPIIMLTSRNGEADEIISMSYGADDFIAKPFSPQILLLRIEAVLNRSNATDEAGKIIYKGLTILPLKSSILVNGTETILSKNELRILVFLVKNHSKIVSRLDIKDYLWDEDQFVDDNTLTVNITRLRKKLEEIGLQNLIQTRRSQGYILE